MRKHNILIHMVAVFFAALLIAGGLTIPGGLLEKQGKDILGQTRKQQINGKTPLPISEIEPTPADRKLSYEEVVSRITLWKESENSLVAREPLEDELTMERASKKGVEELRELVDLGVVPEIHFDGLKLSSAVLNTCVYRPTSQSGRNEEIGKYARWYLVYISSGAAKQEIHVSLDANDGRIYQIQLSADNVGDFMASSQADSVNEEFASYHGIDIEKDGKFSITHLPRQMAAAVLTDKAPQDLPTMKVSVESK
jgi:hypothetical protein